MGKMITICSGSGGVGKSTIALALAMQAAKRGRNTILLDASGTSRSCDLMLGLESLVTLDMVDVIHQQADIDSALYSVPGCKDLRFACASLYDDILTAELSSVVLVLQSLSDILIVDFPTGQTGMGEGLLKRDDAQIIVSRPDDMSMRSAERIMMKMTDRTAERYLVVNRISSAKQRKSTQYDAQTAAMVLDCPLLGGIPEDDSLTGQYLDHGRRESPAARVLSDIADQLFGVVK